MLIYGYKSKYHDDPKLLSIVSAVLPAGRACALTCFVRKKAQREEMDKQGGREGGRRGEEGREGEKVRDMMREDER